MNNILLTIAAVIPAIILVVYIYKKDSAEKEPPKLLAALLFSGVIIAIPVSWLEGIADSTIYNLFLPLTYEQNGDLLLPSQLYYIYEWVDNTIGVALIEEGFKWLALYWITSKNKNFNSLFDGVIYATFVSLGFAGFENILYCLEYGWGTAIARMITAVPAHTFFGIIMGYYYTSWHMLAKARRQEIFYINSGMLHYNKELFSGKKMLVLSVIVPTLIHGYYDFCCSVEEFWATIFFYMLMSGLYIFCFARVRKLSVMDGMDHHIVNAMLWRKYPELREQFSRISTEENK